MRSGLRLLTIAVVLLLSGAHQAFAGKIVLANDEWQTSNQGFGFTPAGSTAFVQNVANFFTGFGPGNFLVVSDNFSLDLDAATSFQAALSAHGHTITDSEDVPGFDLNNLASLLPYNGVFFALPPPANQGVLTSYVNGGGNIYINGGTGVGGPVSEASNWNTLLNAFGLNFASTYNPFTGNIAISSSHQIMSGVGALYQNDGNTITLFGANPNAQIIASFQGQGLYAVYDSQAVVPEPTTLLLLGPGVAWFVARRRSKRS